MICKKILKTLCAVICTGGIVVSMGKIWKIMAEYDRAEDEYSRLEEVYLPAFLQSSMRNDSTAGQDTDTAIIVFPENMVGWICCPDTMLSYPIMQGDDNLFYLSHLPDGDKNACGSIFLDAGDKPDFSNRLSVLYGHHMKDGSMFAVLEKYRDQQFFEAHSEMLLYSDGEAYRVMLFAGFVMDGNGDALVIDTVDKDNYSEWLTRMSENSDFVSAYVPNSKYSTLAMVTCAYDYEDARYVLLGQLIGQE